MRLSIASGKGGTGKTLLATNLATLWSRQGRSVAYIDGDAEEPNGHLFLNPTINLQKRVTVKVPTLGNKKCNYNHKCQEVCSFNAILSVKGHIVVFNELCHSCGACIIACPDNALKETNREIGTISIGTSNSMIFASARLDVGEARVTPLIKEIVKLGDQMSGLVVVDAPPGTSCSAMAAAASADLLLLVTEPTPFGLHDLSLAVEMGRALDLPIAVVINRSDLGNDDVRKYLDRENLPLLAEVPFDRQVATAYAESRLAIDADGPFGESLRTLEKKIIDMMGEEH
jgi:MinD superfamily P-loop ATPase